MEKHLITSVGICPQVRQGRVVFGKVNNLGGASESSKVKVDSKSSVSNEVIKSQNKVEAKQVKKVEKKSNKTKKATLPPTDPLENFYVQLIGYSNELGTALGTLPGCKKLEALLWAPATMYLGADIYDKYARGNNNNYDSHSKTKAFERICYQFMSGMVLSTLGVKAGQGVASYLGKFSKNKLTSTTQCEILTHLQKSLHEGMFSGVSPAEVKREIIEKFQQNLDNTAHDLNLETKKTKIKKFFTGRDIPIAAATSKRENVIHFMEGQIEDLYSAKQILDGTSSKAEIRNNKRFSNLCKKMPPNIKDKTMLTRKLLSKIIQNRISKHQFIKTMGGFATLLSVVVPINYITEHYWINKVVHPGLEKVNTLAQEFPENFKFNSDIFKQNFSHNFIMPVKNTFSFKKGQKN